MKSFTSYSFYAKTLSCLVLACLLAPAMPQAAFAQQTPPARQTPPPQPPPQPSPQRTPPQPQPSPQQQLPQDDPAEDVLRVSTSLVQTDVSVVDKKGQFFEGLQRDQFELKVDGRVQPVLFFERVTAGSSTEAARIAAARGEKIDARAASPVERGRTVVFFVDDFHLTPEGIERARGILLKFIDGEMTPGMEVLISSASGQIGFLQQFTNDRAVLRAAARRLKYQSQSALDTERPPMTEYQALAVDRGDGSILEYLIQQVIFENSPNSYPRNVAENMVRNRARHIRRQAALLSGASISTLEAVVRARGTAPAGRQTLFYISNGFMFDNQEADSVRKLQRVIDAAARSGTVVYTLDARGLTVGMQDASSAGVPDLARESGSPTANAYSGYNASAEVSASQEVLRGIAEDTGGRALLNTNALDAAVSKTLNETANYYLLAWRPEGMEAGTSGAPMFHKIEISIKGRPDLNVRVRRGFLDARTARLAATAPPSVATANTTTVPAAPTSTNVALNNALNAPGARRELPVDAYPVFTNDAQGGSVINASVQLTNDRLKFAPPATPGGKSQAQVEVVCVVLDDKGKGIYSDGRTLTLGGDSSSTAAANGAGEKSRGKLVTNFSIPILAPGLYQVRAVARDSNSGLVGSAFEWVEVPDLKTNRLALSSLLVTERRRANTQPAAAAAAGTTAIQPPDILRVDRRFARSSRALLQLYIYNAASKTANVAPDVELEIKILRDRRAVMNAPPHKVALAAGSDPARIFYVAEIPLGQMTPGVYLLQVTVTDRAARTTVTRELDFYVE
jgi:VWFA-related protein